MALAETKLPTMPQRLPETVPIKALYVGDRIEARALEPVEPLALTPLAMPCGDSGVGVFFRYGVVVLFNVAPDAEKNILERLAPHIAGPLAAPETENARLQVKPEADMQPDIAGTILVRNATVECFQVVADALAKSLILAHYETRIAGIFDRIEPLAAELRERGRIAAYGTALVRQIGDVLHMEHRMVGRVETGEKPELLWEHPELERLYLRLAEEYELRERSRALDRKLEVISRTAETLLGLLQNRSSLRVEWYILALIVAELVLSIYPLLSHL